MKISISTQQNLRFFSLLIITLITTIFLYRLVHPEWILYKQGNDYYAKKDYEKAIAAYTASFTKGLKQSKFLLNLAQSYVSIGNFDEAIKVYRKYLEIHPKDKKARLAFARVLAWNQNFDESEKEFKILLEDKNE